jgi:hypothetical protein
MLYAGLTCKSHGNRRMRPVRPEPWRVIVIRAWFDGDSIRARILVDADGPRSRAAAGVTETVELIRALLTDLESEGQTSQPQDG